MPKKDPNIAFVGKRDGHQPLMLINNGDTTIKLPKKQAQPFFHVDAAKIIRLFPYLYKPVRPKN